MTIVVWETKASKYLGGGVRKFDKWEDLINYMRSKYPLWVIEFDVPDWVRRSCEEKIDVRVIMYDDYLE